jgi:hypothetical protein
MQKTCQKPVSGDRPDVSVSYTTDVAKTHGNRAVQPPDIDLILRDISMP